MTFLFVPIIYFDHIPPSANFSYPFPFYILIVPLLLACPFLPSTFHMRKKIREKGLFHLTWSLVPLIYLKITLFVLLYDWIILPCVYMQHFLYPFICW
jgi:hypothetical protein